jgi:phosphate transport system permease protein
MYSSNIKFRITKSSGMQIITTILAFSIVLPLIFILLFIIKSGIQHVNWHFLVNVFKPEGEPNPGIAHALLGTILIVVLASVISIPIGILCGVYLSENKKSKLAYWSSLCVDVLQGVPSIVIGIVIFAWLHQRFGYFALAGSFALGIMMLPIIIRSTEETLKLLPDSLKEAGFALGMPFHRVILKVILPCGVSGILSGVMLSVARVSGETAPLLFTAGVSHYLSSNIFKGPMQSLPLLIYDYYSLPSRETDPNSFINQAWGASVILLVFVLLLNISTKLITRKWKVQL